MNITVHLLNAFTQAPHGGNPAGVVLEAAHLTETHMQTIARLIGYSETAFVLPSTQAPRRLRFFTPNGEVDLCGHATIATYTLLWKHGKIGLGTTYHELKAGILAVAVETDGRVVMHQTQPEFGTIVPAEMAARILNIPAEWITQTGLQPQVVSTGLRDIFVPLDSRTHLWAIEPNFDMMRMFNQETQTGGFHVFTLDTLDPEATAHCRNFSPLYDINEEAATGSSSGALACYLWHNGLVAAEELTGMVFEQGNVMQRPSHIGAGLRLSNGAIEAVWITGQAIEVGQRQIVLAEG